MNIFKQVILSLRISQMTMLNIKSHLNLSTNYSMMHALIAIGFMRLYGDVIKWMRAKTLSQDKPWSQL